MKFLYRTYQLLVALPLGVMYTIITAIMVVVGTRLFSRKYFGYQPGKWWGWFLIRLFLLPVKVYGEENIKDHESYVFVANHQGAFDIFLTYGFLRHDFKWMMKHQLKKIPFVGAACKYSDQIFVDKRSPRKVKETYDNARKILQGGTSVCVFPEGARTFTGHMGTFKRGAFMLADELQLPVVPITINGSFDVMPRMRDMHFIQWHPLSLTIHKPIHPECKGQENISSTISKSYEAVMSGLEEKYKGYVENPDQ